MPTFDSVIKDFVTGDNLEIDRTITNIPSGQTLVKGWMTVKVKTSDSDNQAVIRKIITSVDAPGTGQIVNVGASGTAQIRIDLTPIDTHALTPGIKYNYDIQVKTNTGAIYTPETGKIESRAESSIDTS